MMNQSSQNSSDSAESFIIHLTVNAHFELNNYNPSTTTILPFKQSQNHSCQTSSLDSFACRINADYVDTDRGQMAPLQ